MNSKKNWILIALAIVAFLNGVATQYLEPGVMFSRTDMLFMLIGVTLSFMWYYFDSEQIQYRRGRLLNIGVITIGILAIPYYFIRSRGLKKGFLYIVLFFLVATAWSVLQKGGAYTVYYGIHDHRMR